MKKHIITLMTVKGGTGKTATAGALVQAANMDGRRALAIDLDPQGNLSFWLDAEPTGPTAYSLFNGTEPARIIQHTPSGVDLIPSGGGLINLKTYTGSARRLADALEPIKRKYDFIVVDTGAAMGEIQANALQFANEVIIPLQADLFSIHGLAAVQGIVDAARKKKRTLGYLGALVTMYDPRPTARREFRKMIMAYTAEHNIPYLGEIRNSVRVSEAMAMAEPLYTYAPRCGPAVDYMDLYKRITE